MVVAALSFQPTLAVANAGSVSVEQTTVEVRIVTRLKSDPTVERQLVDQVVLRNPLLRNSAQP